MSLYCGIDLHSSNCQIVVLNEKLETVLKRRQRNELVEIVELLEPHREELVGIAVVPGETSCAVAPSSCAAAPPSC